MRCRIITVDELAQGLGGGVRERCADVQLKGVIQLVVVPRETPFSLIHLRTLTALSEAGARIVPAIPAWYHQPQSILDLVDFVVARALDQFDLDCVPLKRWDGPIEDSSRHDPNDPTPNIPISNTTIPAQI